MKEHAIKEAQTIVDIMDSGKGHVVVDVTLTGRPLECLVKFKSGKTSTIMGLFASHIITQLNRTS